MPPKPKNPNRLRKGRDYVRKLDRSLERTPGRERNKGILPHFPIGSDYVAGIVSGIPSDIINEFGDWRPWIPAFERQSTRVFDTMACVSFSALNCLETLHQFRYGTEVNYSDRWLAKVSGTGRTGNYLRAVGDSIRSFGLVDEGLWPFPVMADWEEYYAQPSDGLFIQAGLFLEEYEVGYEFVSFHSAPDTSEYFRQELKKGPLQVTIGSQVVESHAVELLHVEPDGSKWIFDHYGTGLTWMHPDRRIFTALRYHYIKKSEIPPPMLKLPENCLVFMAEPPGKYGLHVNGKMYVDETVKLLAQWVSRNEKNNVFSGGPSMSVSALEFNQFKQFNLRNEPI